jgi:hypothetical protein
MTLQELKTEIQRHEPGINGRLEGSLDLAKQQGTRLLEAKRKVRFGKWDEWKASLGKPAPRTCELYMQIAKDDDIPQNIKSIYRFQSYIDEKKKNVKKLIRQLDIEEAKSFLSVDDRNWQVRHADNRKFKFPMTDHIFTDPPWGEVSAYEWLAGMAREKLKEGGFLAVQCDTNDLAKVFPVFRDFEYVHTLAIVYDSAGYATGEFVTIWKPVLLFSKGKARMPNDPVIDTVRVERGSKQYKQYDDWQQPLEPFLEWIPALTKPLEIICDPFCCTGTNGVACKLRGRRFIGTEIRADMVAVARKRIARGE